MVVLYSHRIVAIVTLKVSIKIITIRSSSLTKLYLVLSFPLYYL
jgi:hypothetical protein